MRNERGFVTGEVFFVAFILALIGAWLTHIVVSIKTGAFVLLLAGAILFPIGIIHGVGVWFGFFN